MQNILIKIEKICQKYPEYIAVADENSQLTYKELLQEMHTIGSALLPFGHQNQPIVVYLDKTPKCVSAILGVGISGNFYVVLDTMMPEERIKGIFQTLQPVLVITDQIHQEQAEKFCEGVSVLTCEELCRGEIDEEGLLSVREKMVDTDPVYALYTSGSTGKPKGALINRKALYAYTEWFVNEFNIDETTVFGSQTPLFFSMSVSDLYGALRTGGTYQIIPKKYFSFPMMLIDYMNRFHINTIYWVPFALCIVANWDTFSCGKPQYLQKVLFAGESMPNKQLNYWRKNLPDVFFANLFGPTETTDICCFYVVDRPFRDDETLPIGYACANCGLLIVDENGQEAETGELLVKGPFLSNGYYNDWKKTAEVFIQNPLQSAYPEIVYKTGDLVKKGKNGELLYLGRKDFQIKHMGYRIEIGEIEAAICSLDRIQSCVCIYDQDKDKIILVYQGKVKEPQLVQAIQQKLPSYMRPNIYISMKQLPQNANGKIDRNYLKKHYMEIMQKNQV